MFALYGNLVNGRRNGIARRKFMTRCCPFRPGGAPKTAKELRTEFVPSEGVGHPPKNSAKVKIAEEKRYSRMGVFADSGNAGVMAQRMPGSRLGTIQIAADAGGLITTAVGLVVGSANSAAASLRELAAFRAGAAYLAFRGLFEIPAVRALVITPIVDNR